MVLIRPEEKQNMSLSGGQSTAVKLKTPKRVLHFCDGVLEEYSTDEEDNIIPNQQIVNPATMSWGPWVWYKAWCVGNSTLNVVDTVGEFLSSVFGITTPRYYFELEEYKRREEQKRRQNEKASGWSQPTNAASSVPLKEMGNGSQPIDV